MITQLNYLSKCCTRWRYLLPQ